MSNIILPFFFSSSSSSSQLSALSSSSSVLSGSSVSVPIGVTASGSTSSSSAPASKEATVKESELHCYGQTRQYSDGERNGAIVNLKNPIQSTPSPDSPSHQTNFRCTQAFPTRIKNILFNFSSQCHWMLKLQRFPNKTVVHCVVDTRLQMDPGIQNADSEAFVFLEINASK